MDTQQVEEIKVFIEFGVSEKEKKVALENLKKYEKNPIGLSVLKDFYARLPELREEAVRDISKITSKLEAHLLLVKTSNYEYLYIYDGKDAYYIGEKKDGIRESEVLAFFGYSSNENFLKGFSTQGKGEEPFVEKTFCPACSVGEGEIHQFGCPVEICPWCDSQFNYCNCRFERLGVDEIETEQDLDRLEVILNDKGRIPFAADHAPAYPSGLSDDDKEE